MLVFFFGCNGVVKLWLTCVRGEKKFAQELTVRGVGVVVKWGPHPLKAKKVDERREAL